MTRVACTWQPTCIFEGLECFFSGTAIGTNFLWLRNREPCSPHLLFQPGPADSTQEASARRSGEMLNGFQHYNQRRRTDKPQCDECVCVLMAHNVDAHTCLCVLAKFALIAGLSQVRHATRGEKEVVWGKVCTLAIRPVVSSCLTETSVFVKCCVTMSFPKCHLKKEVDRARREQSGDSRMSWDGLVIIQQLFITATAPRYISSLSLKHSHIHLHHFVSPAFTS